MSRRHLFHYQRTHSRVQELGEGALDTVVNMTLRTLSPPLCTDVEIHGASRVGLAGSSPLCFRMPELALHPESGREGWKYTALRSCLVVGASVMVCLN